MKKTVISARRSNCTLYFWYDKNSRLNGGANMSESPELAFDFSEIGKEAAEKKKVQLALTFSGLNAWKVEQIRK